MKKKIILILVLMSSVILLGQDIDIHPQTPYYQSILTATNDTVDVTFDQVDKRIFAGISTYTFTAYTTTGIDTVNIFTKSLDGTIWVSKASFEITTTPVEYGIDDPEPSAIRVISTSNDASTTIFVLAGKKGLINDYGETTNPGTVVKFHNDTTSNGNDYWSLIANFSEYVWLTIEADDSIDFCFDSTYATGNFGILEPNATTTPASFTFQMQLDPVTKPYIYYRRHSFTGATGTPNVRIFATGR